MKKLSPQQEAALALVRAGRVQYGHEFPDMARRGRDTFPVFLIDGAAAYGQQSRTFASLEERGLIVVRHNLIPLRRVPERTRAYRTVAGFERTVTVPAHDAPVDPGWRTTVEVADGG